MRVGRGFVGPMSNNHRKCTSHRHSPFLYTAVLILLELILVLAGCGDISLNQLLENQEPGEFTVNPRVVNLEVGKELALSASGGFKPYQFVWVSGPNPDDLDTEKGIYKAPDSIGGSTESVVLKGVDYFNAEIETQITVHNSLTLNKTTHTMKETETFDFDPIGGIGPFAFTLNGAIDPSLNFWTGWFDPAGPGIYIVEVTDSIDNMAMARVTVLEEGTALAIDPLAANVVIDGPSVTFTAVNSSPTPSFSRDPAIGDWNTSGVQATFSVSSPESPQIVMIILEDGGETVTAQANIVASDPGPLYVVPPPYKPGYKIDRESGLIFTVSGGVRPYDVGILDKEYYGQPFGTLEILPPELASQRVIYHAPNRAVNIWITFDDSAGAYKEVKIKVQ
jgi:hypothetical protein